MYDSGTIFNKYHFSWICQKIVLLVYIFTSFFGQNFMSFINEQNMHFDHRLISWSGRNMTKNQLKLATARTVSNAFKPQYLKLNWGRGGVVVEKKTFWYIYPKVWYIEVKIQIENVVRTSDPLWYIHGIWDIDVRDAEVQLYNFIHRCKPQVILKQNETIARGLRPWTWLWPAQTVLT